MKIPIIKTKLYVPKLRNRMVSRSKLIEQLNTNSDCKLVLISAPTGFGKSTLISEWATQSDDFFTWISLDEKDNNLIRFLSYFVEALQKIDANLCEGVFEMINSLESIGIDTILTTIVNDIEAISTRVVFVLDDYHLINDEVINKVLNFLLDHLPPNMRLVIITREEPLLSLGRLRSKNQLVEVTTSELRFNHSEVVAFFNQVMDIELSDKDIKCLENRTEGWIAGLQLVAISLKKQKDRSHFIESFSGSHHYIKDYLIEEVLSQMSEELQSFLLQTSILNRLSGPLCDAILFSTIKPAQQILEELCNKNMFIIPLDNDCEWYRYHHLFLQLLRKKVLEKYPLNEDNEGETVYELHGRASQWFENNGLINESIDHAILGKNFKRAASLIEMSWPDMDQNLQSGVWLSWVKKIPDKLIQLRPNLCVGYAWALLDSGELEGCKTWLNDAEKCINILSENNAQQRALYLKMNISDEEQYKLLPAMISAARGYLALAQGEIEVAITYTKNALTLFPKGENYNKDIVKTMLGLAQWTNGQIDDAFKTIIQGTKNITMEIMVAVVLAELSIEQGKLHQASLIYEKALHKSINKKHIYQVMLASFYLGLGNIELLRGNLDKVDALLQKSKVYAKTSALPNWQYKWYLLKARYFESQGEFSEALDKYNESELYYFDEPLPDTLPLNAAKVRVFLKQGKINAAMEWINKQHFKIDGELSYIREFEYITWIRVMIAEFKNFNNNQALSDAKRLIKRLLKETLKGERINKVIELYILQALVEDFYGALDKALESLNNALKLGESEEYIQLFIDEGLQMYQLLSRITIKGTTSIYLLRLLETFKRSKLLNRAEATTSQKDIKKLTKREKEILLLIAEGLSNQEISERLFLALSTVKNYNRSLFDKLEVKSRTSAINKSRELGLI